MPKESFDLAEATELVKHDFQSSFLPFFHDWELFEYDPAARLAALQNKIEGYDARPPRELPISFRRSDLLQTLSYRGGRVSCLSWKWSVLPLS